MTARCIRPQGFAPWAPRAGTVVLLATVRAVLDEYAGRLPQACRQLFYQLVRGHGFAKTEAAMPGCARQ